MQLGECVSHTAGNSEESGRGFGGDSLGALASIKRKLAVNTISRTNGFGSSSLEVSVGKEALQVACIKGVIGGGINFNAIHALGGSIHAVLRAHVHSFERIADSGPVCNFISQFLAFAEKISAVQRSEERRVGKESRSRWSPY